MAKILVLMGGGIDSTALLLHLVHEGYSCEAIHFDYGQKACVPERVAIDYRCKQLKVPLKTFYVPLNELGGSDILKDSQVGTNVLEGRNMIFVALAATYAASKQIECIALGLHAQPADTSFPDTTAAAFNVMRQVMKEMYRAHILLYAPFLNKERQELMEIGCALDSAFLIYTHTCYEDVEGGCQHCAKCKQRAVMIHNMMQPHAKRALPENR